jgi:hypothetical protein
MVVIRRVEGCCRKYVSAARIGLLASAALLVSAADCGAQPVVAKNDKTSHQNSQTAQPLSPSPPKPVVIVVEPSALEVDAIAKQEEAASRTMGLPPDVWVAIFTAVLSFSTILLWRSTDKSAKAAARAAEIAERALVDLEAPSIFLEVEREFSEITTVVPATMGGGTTTTIKVPGDWYFRFVNYGRTPAFLLTVNGDVSHIKQGAGIPVMVKESDVQIPRGAVIPPADRSKKFTLRLPIVAENTNVFVSVCCRFVDIFNNEFLAGFSYFTTNEEDGFRLTDYKSGYNYLMLVKSGTKQNKQHGAPLS